MPRTFGVVRPYDNRLHEKIVAFLNESGFEQQPGATLAPGTPDEVAARWVDHLSVDLLVLPFHVHRTSDGTALDGIGVAQLLSSRFDEELSPLLMPVSKFSWQTSFHRRMDTLKRQRPQLAGRIIVMPQHEIGGVRIAQALGVKRPVRSSGADKGALDTSAALKNFPRTSAMSGSLRAVRMDEPKGAPHADQSEGEPNE